VCPIPCSPARRAQYLSETGFIDTIEGQQVQSQRKPIVLDGKVAICASDIQMYINKTMLQMLSVKAVASMLGALGGMSIRVRGQKFKEPERAKRSTSASEKPAWR
jgi:hypothetical protein